ncbi:MAG: prolyl oligopeptidase family serine peptidase [Candidatus Neomarinimicrobiota bacterium]|nr:prolyl oligopeptidase family serine peptidase [Candidatus Neomarinimicrobiota bacterium]
MNKSLLRIRRIPILALLTIFIACDDTAKEACPVAEQGKYISVRNAGEMDAQFISDLKPSYGLPDDFSILYDIKVYIVEYETTDPKGNNVIASGAVYVPVNPGDKPISLVSGQHGLTIKRSDVASVLPLYGYLGIFGASIGYAVIQPDYLGLGSSTFPYYPVYQKTNGKFLLDMVEGMQSFACENEINLNENLYLIGYSNGGYNSIAMHNELALNPRTFDIDASVVIAGYFDLEREDNFSYPERIGRPSWAVYHPYVLNKTYELNIMDKIIQRPYVDRLDDLFNGDMAAPVIDRELTDITTKLFTSEYLDNYNSLSIFDTYRDVITSNSLIDTKISGDLLLIHSKEDEVVPFQQSEKLYNSVLSKGGNVELVLLEKGKHSPQDYAPAVVEALEWLKQYE